MLPLNSLMAPTGSLYRFCTKDDFSDKNRNKTDNNHHHHVNINIVQSPNNSTHDDERSLNNSNNSIANSASNSNSYNRNDNNFSCSKSCVPSDLDFNPECFLSVIVNSSSSSKSEAEPETEVAEMADNLNVRSSTNNSELVSSKSTSRSSTTTQQQSSTSSSVVISTSNIQLKQKQEVISTSSNITGSVQQQQQQQQQKTSQIVQQQQQQKNIQQQQTQQTFSQKQIQNQQSLSKTQENFINRQNQQQIQTQQTQSQAQQIVVGNNNEEEQQQLAGDEDLKVKGVVVGVNADDEENHSSLYFSNMIKNEQLLLNTENHNSSPYCLSDDIPESNINTNIININNVNNNNTTNCVVDGPIIDININNNNNDTDTNLSSNNINHNHSLIIHPDLISGLSTTTSSSVASVSSQPPSLVLSTDNSYNKHSNNSNINRLLHDTSSSISSSKCSEEGSLGHDDLYQYGPGTGEGEQHVNDDDDDEEDQDEDGVTDLNGLIREEKDQHRRKKKKVKKTESFSVIEVHQHDKMKDLAEKYEVYENNNHQNPSTPCLRASEKKVFASVSVKNLRRSFCDLTSNLNSNNHEDEFNFHLVERPKSSTNINFTNLDYTIDFHSIKSSFSKFEGGANNRNSEDRDSANNNIKNESKSGTRICKACNEEVFVMEQIKAEKNTFHKRCFRCTTCKKALTMDNYESNSGQLYCKPHFKELFQPKPAFETPEELVSRMKKKRPELIIRENEPVELPPDVVRATIQPATADLEDLSVDVKSKFELFENFKESEQQDREKREPIKVIRSSSSALSKLTKRYEGGAMDQIGVSDNELNGGAPTTVSDDEEDDHIPTGKLQPVDEINYKLDDMKSKWESGMNSKKEEIHKHRQEEMAKFRTRLCLGKNSQLKEMYEKAVESNVEEKSKTLDLNELDLKGKRDIKEMFEKGIVNKADDDETANDREPRSTIDLDRDVFESGVAKTSRNLFQNLDKQVACGNGQANAPGAPKKISFKNPNSIVGVNDQQSGEVIKSSDIVPDQCRSEDVGSKFKFFENFQESQERQKKEKVFRITPPREGQVKMDSPEREIYRDPNVIRSTDDTEQIKIPVARTASKMLSVFKKLEEKAASDEVDGSQRRGLKQFTPPRETRLERKDSSEEEESSEYESEEDDQEYEQNGNGVHNEDQFLKEVGSLAKAKSLRAKFEKWENEENSKNEGGRFQNPHDELTNGNSSIESAKALRARFEQPQQFFEPQKTKPNVQVKRFVELQNSNGLAMEECVMCTKRVYAMEKTEAGGKIYHKQCFRCSQCKCILRMDTFTQNKGTLYCTPHFKQLFKIKGNYDEGFGHETGKQIWMKKQQAKASESASETKEN